MFVTDARRRREGGRPSSRTSGLDPLDARDVAGTTSVALVAPKHAKLKPLLMDQKFLAGIGNIYCDEILFGAGLRWDRMSDSLSPRGGPAALPRDGRDAAGRGEVPRLVARRRAVRRPLRQARASTSTHHKVYAREGEACRRCRHADRARARRRPLDVLLRGLPGVTACAIATPRVRRRVGTGPGRVVPRVVPRAGASRGRERAGSATSSDGRVEAVFEGPPAAVDARRRAGAATARRAPGSTGSRSPTRRPSARPGSACADRRVLGRGPDLRRRASAERPNASVRCAAAQTTPGSRVFLKSLTLRGLQVVRRQDDARVRARRHRRRRPERLRQVEPRRRRRVGARRAGPAHAARREDGRRHLRRHARPARARAGPRCRSRSTTPPACSRSSSPRSRSPARCSAPATPSTRSTARPCRLLDIQELLSDTGIGRQQHVIVGPGPARRGAERPPRGPPGVIEEAAGVLKFRKRRERAERRLESTEGNLLRLNDLAARGPAAAHAARSSRPTRPAATAGSWPSCARSASTSSATRSPGLQARIERLRDTRHRARRDGADGPGPAARARHRGARRRARADRARATTTSPTRSCGSSRCASAAAGLLALLAEKRRGLERELAAAADEGVVETLVADAGALRARARRGRATPRRLGPELAEVEAAEHELAAARAARARRAVPTTPRRWREADAAPRRRRRAGVPPSATPPGAGRGPTPSTQASTALRAAGRGRSLERIDGIAGRRSSTTSRSKPGAEAGRRRGARRRDARGRRRRRDAARRRGRAARRPGDAQALLLVARRATAVDAPAAPLVPAGHAAARRRCVRCDPHRPAGALAPAPAGRRARRAGWQRAASTSRSTDPGSSVITRRATASAVPARGASVASRRRRCTPAALAAAVEEAAAAERRRAEAEAERAAADAALSTVRSRVHDAQEERLTRASRPGAPRRSRSAPAPRPRGARRHARGAPSSVDPPARRRRGPPRQPRPGGAGSRRAPPGRARRPAGRVRRGRPTAAVAPRAGRRAASTGSRRAPASAVGAGERVGRAARRAAAASGRQLEQQLAETRERLSRGRGRRGRDPDAARGRGRAAPHRLRLRARASRSTRPSPRCPRARRSPGGRASSSASCGSWARSTRSRSRSTTRCSERHDVPAAAARRREGQPARAACA